MGISVGQLHPVTARQLTSWVKLSSGVSKFEPARRYGADLKGQPENARLLCAMQLMFLEVWPKDMTTYFQSGTPDHTLADQKKYPGFAGIFEASTRTALLDLFTSADVFDEGTRQVLDGADFTKAFGSVAVGDELGGAISIHELNNGLLLRPAEISEAEEPQWAKALINVSEAVNRYYLYRGCPQARLPETTDFLSSTVQFLFSKSSIGIARKYLDLG